MKKYFALLTAAVLLSGCSVAGDKQDQAMKTVQASSNGSKPATSDLLIPNPQVSDDSSLAKEGDSISDRKGELTLKQIKQVNKTLTIGGIDYTVKDIKLLHYVPDYSLIDFYHPYTHDEEFDFIKVGIELKNSSDEGYHFAPIAFMKLNNDIIKTWEDDFYLEELNGGIQPGQVKKGNMGFIVDELDSLEAVELLTGDLVDLGKAKEAEPVKLNIKM
ncbi:DUF4352 domain-containing protein [Mesobacillus subterraneus]|uniref:DUF4352 domain-containing protein n=2 Tax=Mesobacillus subterraneus TaxID=285983 RepID=A0A3R9EYZ7_9BACI|nr:DUF4352 domain-containing protein [Mesobacillus subterraneus]